MQFADIQLVTKFLHPQPREEHAGFPPEMIPLGLDEFIGPLGLGEISQGLTIFTDAARQKHWPASFVHDAIYQIYELGAWDSGVLELSDLTNCLVVADTDHGDVFITCPRLGRTIFELPRHESTIHVVGDSIGDLLDYHLHRFRLNFLAFDPDRSCSRRGAIQFTLRSEIDLAQFDALLQSAWGVDPRGSTNSSHPEFFQDRFVPALHACVGIYLEDDGRPRENIAVTMTLDRDSVPAVQRWAETISLAGFDFGPNYGRDCAHS
ncbi:hypothetical protein [Anatilimnocola floriformis]|uniref:hypothetical protein n=1 Tax=Anatilimnocola floriformis TaxID=2948575 RepID=UPI0020C4F311|nr:hypothetical protein [Anatilimnocola floriformis]